MRKKSLARSLVAIPFLATTVIFADPAVAASFQICADDSYSGGAQVFPGRGERGAGGGPAKTTSQRTMQARNTWDHWAWRSNPPKICPEEAKKTGKNCKFTWSETSTTSVSWSFGGLVLGGNSNNPKDKEWKNVLAGLIPYWSRTTTKTEGIDLASEVAPGDKAYAAKVVQMRWERGDFKGGFVRENRGCTVGVNGRGTLYRWEPDLRWGRWERSVPTGYEFKGIAINDRF